MQLIETSLLFMRC